MCECECWVEQVLNQLCPRVFAKMGNDHQLPLYILTTHELGATNLLHILPAGQTVELAAGFENVPVSAAGGLSHPGVCPGHSYRGLRSLQASGCSFMLLCLRNHVTMYLPHTVFISTLQFICTKASRQN